MTAARKTRRRAASAGKPTRGAGAARIQRRLQDLYEISKLFASFENSEETFDPALRIVARTLRIRSAILIEADEHRSRMIVWCSEGEKAGRAEVIKKHAETAYGYLIGATAADPLDFSAQPGRTPLPRQAREKKPVENRFIIIPLVVARRPLFGILQLEGARSLDKLDLMFVNAIANQLAIALDRDRAWRRDILRRTHAEEGRARAEARGAAAERSSILADSGRNESAALAEENARLLAEANEALLMREQILEIVSHDLRSPLTTIFLYTKSLAEPRAREVAVKIDRAADRIQRLIEDLLDFASIRAGKLGVRQAPEDAGSIVRELVESFEGIAQEKGVRLTAELGSNLPEVRCDRDRILQVLANLVGNATRVTPAGGTIALRVEARGPELVFAVCDDGPGIAAAEVEHLFDRYWRSGTAPYRGTGLGLAIARGIVTAHGGRIWVESEPGRGAAFFFTVPA